MTAPYEPTAAEIRQAAEKIRAGWSKTEERRRRAAPEGWTAPEVPYVELAGRSRKTPDRKT